MEQLNGIMTIKVIFSQTEDEALSDIVEESDEISGTLTIELSKGKAVFTPDVSPNSSNGIYSNVIIEKCNSIEISPEDEKIVLYNEDGKWLFDIKNQ